MLTDHLKNIVLDYGEVGRRRELAVDFADMMLLMRNKPCSRTSVSLSPKQWKEVLLRYKIRTRQYLHGQLEYVTFDVE